MAKIVWRSRALEMRRNMLQYCHANFGVNVAQKFNTKVGRCVQRLGSNPRMGCHLPELDTAGKTFRRIFINKVISMVYHYDELSDLPEEV